MKVCLIIAIVIESISFLTGLIRSCQQPTVAQRLGFLIGTTIGNGFMLFVLIKCLKLV